jgi:hypothetical protein
MEWLSKFTPPSEFFKTHYLVKDTDLDPLLEREDFKSMFCNGNNL